ncbi:hypothetical protein LCGC14_0734390 [marine sediment metagenome]|uniref:Uncharacterized protein n=1 Tax=marine sediment metagenome TaxID=412755 RepID=A0A0F9Q8Q5_9ZZZZ
MAKATLDDVRDGSHECDPDEAFPVYDGRGLYLCRACDDCKEAKLSQYRPEILEYYTQADVDEPIEEDGWS